MIQFFHNHQRNHNPIFLKSPQSIWCLNQYIRINYIIFHACLSLLQNLPKSVSSHIRCDETDLKKMMNHPFTGVSSFYEINMKFQISFRKINVKYFYFPIDCFSHCRFHSTHSPRRSSPAILYRLPFSGLSAQIPESSVLLLLSARRPPARHDHTGTLFPALLRFPFFLRDFPHR